MEEKQEKNTKNDKNSPVKSGKIVKSKQKTAAKSDKPGMFAGWLIFLKEVKVEMKKVNWPPRKEIIGSTTALIVATVLIGVFLGIVDMILVQGIRPALAGNAGIMSAVTLILFVGIIVWVYRSN